MQRKILLLVVALIACAPYHAFSWQGYKLEDVSPGPGSTPLPEPGLYSLWGKMLTVTATGLEGAAGPPTHWSSINGDVTVEHVAAADKDGHLVLFYSYPGSDWKAVNVMEKTNSVIAVVRPESWLFPEGPIVLERIAAPSPSNDLLLFTWHAGSDWTVTNLTTTTKVKVTGPLTSWQTPLGDKMVEHIGARGTDNHFLVFWRIAGGDWATVDITALTGQEVGDSGTSWTQNLGPEWLESVAMPDTSGDLILFTFKPSTNWQAQNLGQVTGQKVGGPAVHWTSPAVARKENLAAPAPNHDLVLFYTDPIDGGWHVLNISAITHRSVVGPVANWNSTPGGAGSWSEHLAGRGTDDHLCVFFKPTGGTWQVTDVTQATNGTISQPPTAWITAAGTYAGENVAAPSWDGHMYIFTDNGSTGWSRVDVSLRSYGRTVYAAAEMAGVWRSRDYGTTWQQMVRPQPDPTVPITDGLDVPAVLDLAASPTDPNLVLAATDVDHRNPSRTGAYRSTDAGETWKLVHQFVRTDPAKPDVKEFMPVTQVLFAPGNPKLVYAAGGTAIAVSYDRGAEGTWTESAPPDLGPNQRIWHLVVSPELASEVRRGYACGDGAFWCFSHSVVTPKPWSWKLDQAAASALPAKFGEETRSTYLGAVAAQVLAIEPGNPAHVYLAYPGHANGPSYYHPIDGGPPGVRVNIPVVYDANDNKKFESSEEIIWTGGASQQPRPALGPNDTLTHDPKLRFVDNPPVNGHWDKGETVVHDTNDDHQFSALPQISADAQEPAWLGDKPAVGTKLSDDPLIKYIDKGGPFGPRGAGEGSLWFGDFSGTDPASPGTLSGTWENLPGPPVYFGYSTDSGAAFVFTQPTKSGYLVLFSNRESVHVSVGKPAAGSWHRLGARDASESKRQNDENNKKFYVHVDPHGLAVSPDFDLTLVPSDQPSPYDQNTELPRPIPPITAKFPEQELGRGRIWLTSDGGVYRSDDLGQHWIPAQSGLSTLASHNIAGVAQVSSVPGKPNQPPALYFGATDNDDFFSVNGGKTWQSAHGGCGDCDVWYADPAQPNRVWRHPPRGSSAAFVVFVNNGGPPNPQDGNQFHPVDPPSGSTVPPEAGEGGNDGYFKGSRPIVQTLAGEAPLNNGDYVLVRDVTSPSRRILFRAQDSLGSSSPWAQVGPDLPPPGVHRTGVRRTCRHGLLCRESEWPLAVAAAGRTDDQRVAAGRSGRRRHTGLAVLREPV